MNNNGQHTIATNAPFSLARRTTTDRPAARSRSPSSPPAHPSARGRGTNSSRQSDESRGEGVGRRMEDGGGGGWIRASVLVHIIVVASSRRRFIPSPSSSHLLSRPVVARLVVSSVIRSVRRFHLLVAIRFVVVPPSPRLVVVSFRLSFRFPSRRRSVPRLVVLSVVVLPHRAPFRLLVAHRLAPSFRRRPASSSRSSSVGSSSLPVHRHGRAGAFFSFDSEAGKQAEGVAGRVIARGVASMRWARSVAGKQAAGDG